jgi:hypothetical protein
MDGNEKNTLLPPEYQAILSELDSNKREQIEVFFQMALLAVKQPLTVSDFWEQPELTTTYWILLLSGVNQEEEMDVAKTLLIWKAFIAKDSAMVLCVPHSDREQFKCCSSKFGAVKTPTLVLSDSRNMDNSIIIDSQLLLTLSSNKGNLQRFLTEVHSIIENGGTLYDVDSQLRTEQFWKGLKLVYSEVKSLLSFVK